MEIDLGEEIVFTVKLKGKEYPLSEPTVEQVKHLRDGLKDDDDVSSLNSFICELGMPEEVLKKLSITQMKKLADGLIGGLSEKK